MVGYFVSGLCILSGAYLAGMNASGWPWFLIAGVLMFITSAGTEMKIRGA